MYVYPGQSHFGQVFGQAFRPPWALWSFQPYHAVRLAITICSARVARCG